MTMPLVSISPRQTFEDNMRPAQLLLRVYRLLDSSDNILDAGDLVDALRGVVGASAGEDLMCICNELFLGLVRERAQVPRSTLRQATLFHLLRQAVVASCTALETYLPTLWRASLPVVIRARGRDFMPRTDRVVKSFFKSLTFSLDEMMRLLNDEDAPDYIANKIVGFADYKYLGGSNGPHVVGLLFGMADPWAEIAERLDRNQEELRKTFDETVKRRNDIVHRADRSQSDPGGSAQDIGYAWTRHAVDTINHVCLALDELVTVRVAELEALIPE